MSVRHTGLYDLCSAEKEWNSVCVFKGETWIEQGGSTRCKPAQVNPWLFQTSGEWYNSRKVRGHFLLFSWITTVEVKFELLLHYINIDRMNVWWLFHHTYIRQLQIYIQCCDRGLLTAVQPGVWKWSVGKCRTVPLSDILKVISIQTCTNHINYLS